MNIGQQPFNRSENVQKIKLVNENPEWVPPGTRCDITGWGTMDYGIKTGSDQMKWNQIPILNVQECGDQYENFDSEAMICAGIKVKHISYIIT